MIRLHWIEDKQLAAGGIPVNRADLEALRDAGISAVVSLTEHPLTEFRDIDEPALESLGLRYLHVPIVDQTPPDVAQVSRVAQFIDRIKADNQAVYIHCHAGIGRTGTLLHAYYLVQGMDFDAVKDRIKAAKPSSQLMMLSASQRAFLQRLAAEFAAPVDDVVETVYFQVVPGQETAFLTALKQVASQLVVTTGYSRHSVQRAVDDPQRYLLMIHWHRADDTFLTYYTDTWQTLFSTTLFDDPFAEHYHTITLDS